MLGAVAATGTTAADGVRRSQPRTRPALAVAPSADWPASPVPSGQSASISPDSPPGATAVSRASVSRASVSRASVSRAAGAVPLVLPTCCAMSLSGFAASFPTHHQPRK